MSDSIRLCCWVCLKSSDDLGGVPLTAEPHDEVEAIVGFCAVPNEDNVRVTPTTLSDCCDLDLARRLATLDAKELSLRADFGLRWIRSFCPFDSVLSDVIEPSSRTRGGRFGARFSLLTVASFDRSLTVPATPVFDTLRLAECALTLTGEIIVRSVEVVLSNVRCLKNRC